MVSLNIRKKSYEIKEEKNYPVDQYHAKKINKLRTQIVILKRHIKDNKDIIISKNKFLEDVYDHIEKEMKKYEKRRSHKTGRAFKP